MYSVLSFQKTARIKRKTGAADEDEAAELLHQLTTDAAMDLRPWTCGKRGRDDPLRRLSRLLVLVLDGRLLALFLADRLLVQSPLFQVLTLCPRMLAPPLARVQNWVS
jgi:hypothetical protein